MCVWNISESRYSSTRTLPNQVICMAVSPHGSKVACYYEYQWGVIFDLQLDTSVDIKVGNANACFDAAGEKLAVTVGFSVVILDANTCEQLLFINFSEGRVDLSSADRFTVMTLHWEFSSNRILATMWNSWAVVDSITGEILRVVDGDVDFCRVLFARPHVLLM